MTGCGLTSGCGSIAWFRKDPLKQNYVVGGNCYSDASSFSKYDAVSCQCPPYNDDILPCTCALSANSLKTLTLNCISQSLNDTAIANFVSKVSPTAPVDTVDFSTNALTKVPQGLPAFSQLVNVSLAHNAITSIGKGDMNLTAQVKLLNFASNEIASIQDGSLPSNYTAGAQINLNSNLLTSLNQSTFLPIVQSFANNNYPSDTTFISVNYLSNLHFF